MQRYFFADFNFKDGNWEFDGFACGTDSEPVSEIKRIDGEMVQTFIQVKLGELYVSNALYKNCVDGLKNNTAFKDYEGVLKLTDDEKQAVLFRVIGNIYLDLATKLESQVKEAESTLERSGSEEGLLASSGKGVKGDGGGVDEIPGSEGVERGV